MTCSEIKKEARDSLKGKWGSGILVVLAYSIIMFVISFVLGLLPENNKILSLIGLVIQFLISVPLTFGLIFTFIKLKRSDKVSPFDFLTLGFSNFGKSWGVALSIAVRLILPIILTIIAVMMIGFSIFYSAGSAIYGSSSPSASVISILGIILYIGSLIYLFIRSVALSLSFYLAYDEPELGGMATTKKSLELMKGHVGKAILLSLSFIGWILLLLLPAIVFYIYSYMNLKSLYFVSAPIATVKMTGLFSIIIPLYMAIGELFLIPYIQTSMVCFYERVVGRNETSPITNTDGNNNE